MIDHLVSELLQNRAHLPIYEESRLTESIYQLVHLRRRQRFESPSDTGAAFASEAVFGMVTRREPGWVRLPAPEREAPVFVRNGLHLSVGLEQVQRDGSLRLPAVRDRYTPGFAALLSENDPPRTGTRIYLAVAEEHVHTVGRILASRLPAVSSGYVVKVLADRGEYPRPDSFTIFLADSDRDPALRMIADCQFDRYTDRSCRRSLFAEAGPGGSAWMEGAAGVSAGESRAACAATALHAHPDVGEATLREALRSEFSRRGFDPDHPHLLLRESRRG